MEREGPCFHCGVNYTPLWRSGPPEKPVLCNACGTRWRVRGSLKDYIPKQVISGKYSACTEDDAKNRSRSKSSRNCIKIGSINGSHKSTASNPPVPKRKRSAPKQRILSPIQRFQWQLYCLSQEPEFSKLREEQEDVLIYHKPSNQMPTEIGLGAVPLKPTPSTNN